MVNAGSELKFEELPVEKLRWQCDPGMLRFKTTNDIDVLANIIGQDRAVSALQLGLDIESKGYNIFVSGLSGTGRKTAVQCLIQETARFKRPPEDKIVVNNFKINDAPLFVRLKVGDGRKFKREMEGLVTYLLKRIPEIFESEAYQKKRQSMVNRFESGEKDLFKVFDEEAGKDNFALVQLQEGSSLQPTLLPLIDGKPTTFDEIRELEKKGKLKRQDLDKMNEIYSRLVDRMEDLYSELREWERKTNEKLFELDKEYVSPMVSERIAELKNLFQNEALNIYLDDLRDSLIENPGKFLPSQDDDTNTPAKLKLPEESDPFIEYRVNLLVDNDSATQAPVIFETFPSYSNLFGTVEVTGDGATDFTKLRAGSFLKADGGFLIVDALELLVEPSVWPAFKRVLKTGKVEIQVYTPMYMVAVSAMKLQPIDVDVKVAIVGDPAIYQELYDQDPDFEKIFKVRADFDSVMSVNQETIRDYANFVKRIACQEKLLPFNNSAVLSVIEYGARLGGKKQKLSTQFTKVADVLREANYWCQKEKKKIVTEKYIQKALKERVNRLSLVEEKIKEMIVDGSLMIDVTGGVIGQVNGLSVCDIGDYAFGKPTRITANVSLGDSGIINIEREVEMSGPIHDKGVLILTGYFRSLYAQDKPFALDASICFEQSYDGIEGDSASSTEIYALLSALAKLPIRQDIAVTGSVNQKGEIQPIGGVVEKIEGFYDVCCAKGRIDSQGVIIPYQNIDNLMLKDEVVNAVKEGSFHIYPVKSIDQGIEILTGIPSGKRNEDGSFEVGSVHYLVDRRVEEYAEKWKLYHK